MASGIENWKTQIRKGYLELCILMLIEKRRLLYGFELLDILEASLLPVKEGTLYPLLNRMTADGVLTSKWETEQTKGHPRKFYSLTKDGKNILQDMKEEFERMSSVYEKIEAKAFQPQILRRTES